jgi:hypothetical protein
MAAWAGARVIVHDNCPGDHRGSLRSPFACL